MQNKTFRFVVNIDIPAPTLEGAYRLLCEHMSTGCDYGWESSDECYEDGELVDADVLQAATDNVYHGDDEPLAVLVTDQA